MNKQEILLRLATASRAPSVHNSQPWRVTVEAADRLRVELRQDIALPYADPTGRGGWMAIGAFVENLGGEAEFRDGIVTVELARHSHEPDHGSAAAIERRATNRVLFGPLADPEEVATGLLRRSSNSLLAKTVGAAEGAEVSFVMGDRVVRLAELVREGTRKAYQSKPFCVEHAEWLRTSFTRRRDGIPGYAIGIPPLLSLALPFIIKHKDVSAMRADMEYKKALSANLFAVITAEKNDPPHWFAAGRAMQRLLLKATAMGIEQSPNAAPIEMGFADDVRSLTDVGHLPQLIIRLGRAPALRRHTPRRPVESFTTWQI